MGRIPYLHYMQASHIPGVSLMDSFVGVVLRELIALKHA